MAALTIVEDLDVLEDRVRELDPGLPLLAVEQLDLDQNDSIIALSRPSPMLPKEGMRPAERILSPKAQDVN